MCHMIEYCIKPVLFNGFMFGLRLAMPTKYGSKFHTEHMLKSSAGIWKNGSKKLKFVLLLWFIFNEQGERLDFFNLDFI